MDILWLGEPACHDRSLVGGKAASLSRLAAKFCVPPGFCLTTAAFEYARASDPGLGEKTATALALPCEIRERLASAYQKLAILCSMSDPCVAVRSSAVDEDSSTASFAGQHETYLNLAGVDAVAKAVLRCRASACSPHVLEYRRQQGLELDRVWLAVLVQQMIPSDISAVVFSVNPVTGSGDEVVLNVNWGLGESIVSGRATPDTYVVRKRSLDVVRRKIAEKRNMTVCIPGGTREVEVPQVMRRDPVLDDAQATEMARLALDLEAAIGWPVDIECSICAGKLYLLQCRPVTAQNVLQCRTVEALAERQTQMAVRDHGSSEDNQIRLETASNADVTEQPAPSPISHPPNFPVAWGHPDDKGLLWTLDRMHLADPVHPLGVPFFRFVYEDGINFAAQVYEWPFRSRTCRINTYNYWTFVPPVAPPEEVEAQNMCSKDKLEAVMGRLSEVWRTELLPEIQRYLADWEAFDLPGATMPHLCAHLEKTVARAKRIWEIHFLIAFPFIVAMSIYDDLSSDLFANESAVDAFRLLRGFDNKSLETDRALRELSHKALALPEVCKVVEECVAADVLPALERSKEGQAFLAEVRAYLREYGQRGQKFDCLCAPSWIEDPTPVIKNLKDYVRDRDRDPLAEMAALAAERQRLLAEARQRLKSYPQPMANRFEFFLRAAQEATVLQEDHNFWIDQRSFYKIRQVLLEFGRRFAASGALDEPEDVFYLTLEELRKTADAASPENWRHLIRDRKAEMEHFRTIKPPLELGTIPATPPPETPIGRAFAKFFGVLPQSPTDPKEVRGNAGSPGKARGPACVVRSLADASKLNKGDVLVAEATMPPWTPLFATAAAVVTDVGGILSHCAVVAREYGIPAVVGTNVATSRIKDGQLLEVDGTAGMIRILSPA